MKLRTISVVAVSVVFFALVAAAGVAPAPASAQTQRTLSFDVASVKQSNGMTPASNVPLGSGDAYTPTNGILRAKNLSLLVYLSFAYRLTGDQEAALKAAAPDWVVQDHYAIEAHTEKLDVTKDELRLMMRTLLAERFRLAVHYASREVPVFALETIRPGMLGPKLRPHPADAMCLGPKLEKTNADGTTVHVPLQAEKGGFPVVCNSIVGVPASAQDRWAFGASDVQMSFVATALSSWGNLGRPVVDRTGLTGTYDVVLDFTPDPRPAYATVDSGGPGFQQALKEQLGLKLEAQRAPVEFLVLDRVERPDEN